MKPPSLLTGCGTANSSLAVLTCIQVSRLLYNQVLTQGFMSAAGTPAGGRHCDSRETAGLTDCAAGKAGCERALPFLQTWLERLQEAFLSTHPTAQNCIGPAPNTARPGQSSAHSNCACAVLLTRCGETQACLQYISASSDKGEALLWNLPGRLPANWLMQCDCKTAYIV